MWLSTASLRWINITSLVLSLVLSIYFFSCVWRLYKSGACPSSPQGHIGDGTVISYLYRCWLSLLCPVLCLKFVTCSGLVSWWKLWCGWGVWHRDFMIAFIFVILLFLIRSLSHFHICHGGKKSIALLFVCSWRCLEPSQVWGVCCLLLLEIQIVHKWLKQLGLYC